MTRKYSIEELEEYARNAINAIGRADKNKKYFFVASNFEHNGNTWTDRERELLKMMSEWCTVHTVMDQYMLHDYLYQHLDAANSNLDCYSNPLIVMPLPYNEDAIVENMRRLLDDDEWEIGCGGNPEWTKNFRPKLNPEGGALL